MSDQKSTAVPPPSRPAPKRKTELKIPADMALYAAFLGKTPQIDPSLADPMTAAIEARRENPWSPMVLSIYLRQICREKAMKINKPELAAWVRKQTAIARKRIQETHARVEAARRDRAA